MLIKELINEDQPASNDTYTPEKYKLWERGRDQIDTAIGTVLYSRFGKSSKFGDIIIELGGDPALIKEVNNALSTLSNSWDELVKNVEITVKNYGKK